MAQEQKTHSGCTAVAAFLRWEDAQSGQSFLKEQQQLQTPSQSLITHPERTVSPAPAELPHSPSPEPAESGRTTPSGGSRIRNAVKHIANRLSTSSTTSTNAAGPLSAGSPARIVNGAKHPPFEPKDGGAGLRKVLYTANAGDARAVLCRGGEALRLTYDHKGSDPQETRRIQNAGGYMLNNRVNGKCSTISWLKL
jgi:protein phosphatase PTC1